MEVDKETGEVKQSPKGKGSFWISKKAIDVLVQNKATAMQINAYLVLAKHTNEGGKFSTSGIKAIHTATGVSHAVAERAVNELMKMSATGNFRKGSVGGLVYLPEDWHKATGETIPPAPFDRAMVRHVLNDFNAAPDDRVWFSNELVAGVGRFSQPLKRLKMCGDVAARVLLLAYEGNNLEQYGGISPLLFYEAYEMSKVNRLDGYDIWHGKHGNTWAYDNASLPALGLTKRIANDDERAEAMRPFWDAIKSLDAAGFIYQMVSVMDREAGNDEAQVIYELDAKSKHGYKPKGEDGLGGITAKLSGRLGNPVTDANGRFYGRYAAIVPAGINPHIVGIYRLRFRVSNTKNHGVASAWARIHQGQREAAEWVSHIAEQHGLSEALGIERHDNNDA